MISRSASRMLLRMLASVLPRQSVSPAISWSIRSDGFIGSLCLPFLHEALNLGYLGVRGGFAMLKSSAPSFIVDDLGATLAFYQSKLGFDVLHTGGGAGDGEDYWAILVRDRAMLFFKAITPEVHPQPNSSRHEWARWDAYIGTDDPDSLYTEFIGREVPMRTGQYGRWTQSLRDHRQQRVRAV